MHPASAIAAFAFMLSVLLCCSRPEEGTDWNFMSKQVDAQFITIVILLLVLAQAVFSWPDLMIAVFRVILNNE